MQSAVAFIYYFIWHHLGALVTW